MYKRYHSNVNADQEREKLCCTTRLARWEAPIQHEDATTARTCIDEQGSRRDCVCDVPAAVDICPHCCHTVRAGVHDWRKNPHQAKVQSAELIVLM
jgi:hypothetical protein